MSQRQNFRYIQFETPNGRGYACVSLAWERTGDIISYNAGVAFCSPFDFFRKDIARMKAEHRRSGSQRIKSKDKQVVSQISSPDPVTNFISNEEFRIIFDDILAKCSVKKAVPKWLLDSHNNGGTHFGLRSPDQPQPIITIPQVPQVIETQKSV